MYTSIRLILNLLIFVLVARSAQGQTTWHVNDACAPPGAGTEVDPFCTIQQGVDAASDGDTVLVAPGTYTGNGNRDISLFGRIITLKSSTGATETILDMKGGPGSIHRAFFLIHGETLNTVIEGFTVKNAYLIGDTGGTGPGGGGGGAVYIRDSSPTIRNCIIRDNISATLHPPFPVDGRGAGIYVDGNSSAVIENCIIADNLADRRGGGMYIGYLASRVEIRNCLISGNSSGGAGNFPGGGLHLVFGSMRISNTAIVDNTSGSTGGGFNAEGSEPILANCILWGNEAGPLFSGQQVAIDGFAIVTITFGAVEGGMEGVDGPGELNWGSGMIDADPLFVDPDSGDFHLLHGSPCIDAANNLAVPAGVTTDLDGGPRFLDDPTAPDTGNPDPDDPKLPIVDMGSYEYDPDDCNNNDTPDEQDIVEGTSQDCNRNGNGIPDECEPDCNENDQADSCDITEGTSEDCTGNGIPDECEPDCNENGQPDSCDIAEGVSEDCNSSGVPDECEPDCNGNGVQDMCDIAAGFSQDCGADGVPDDCPENPGPFITAQPVSQEVAPGDLVLFSVQADGVLPEYQWRKDGEDLTNTERIFGAQSAGLFIFDVELTDAGAYDCEVTDFGGACALSNPATLTVTDSCPADFDDNGLVGAFDLANLLGNWGPNPNHPADLDADDIIGPPDLALLLGDWGPCE